MASLDHVATLPPVSVRLPLIVAALEVEFPGDAPALCELDFATPFQLLAATILSAQCTDRQVNATTPGLFARFPDAPAMAGADRAELERLIFPTGFYRSKADHLLQMAARLCAVYGGEVPTAMEDLVSLAGVGRKTANVVRSVGFGLPGLPVDTHVLRLSRRLDLVRSDDPVVVERRLNQRIDPAQGGTLSLRLILHGRRTCDARSPRCQECSLLQLCPTGLRRVPR